MRCLSQGHGQRVEFNSNCVQNCLKRTPALGITPMGGSLMISQGETRLYYYTVAVLFKSKTFSTVFFLNKIDNLFTDFFNLTF